MIRIVSLLIVAGLLAPLTSSAQPAILKDSVGKPPGARQTFTIDGVEVRLPRPDGLTDDELTTFLRAIKRGAIVWRTEPRLAPRVIPLAAVDFVGVSGPPRLYHVFVKTPIRPNTTYVYEAEFDGTIVTITRASSALR
ncbi:MAG TPA: hypothetical protein VGM22_22845 [Methylomirabilota bacterium]|jgi:hypothetical protein